MIYFTLSEATVNEACQTALELIDGISAIPIEYLKATSLGMVNAPSPNEKLSAHLLLVTRTFWIWSSLEQLHQ